MIGFWSDVGHPPAANLESTLLELKSQCFLNIWVGAQIKVQFTYFSNFLTFNLLGIEHVSYDYFHSRRCLEGIGIKKSDIFANPIYIQLAEIKKEIVNIKNSKTVSGEILFANYFF